MHNMETIGFIGTGNMGMPMASNLLKAGFPLRVFNRSRAKAQPLADQGAQVMAHPEDVVTESGIIIMMVADDAALEAVTAGESGVVERLGQGNVLLNTSTIAPATAMRIAQHTAQRGATYVAAPVFGRPEAAAAAQLWIMVAGPPPARERVRPVLQVLGQGTFDIGDAPHLANVVKLCGNFLIVAAQEAMAEAFTLAEKSGISRETIFHVLTQSVFAHPLYQTYGRLIADQRYAPAGFKLALGLKDITLARETADAAAMPMPLASLVHDRLLEQVAKGRQDLDWSALALGVAEDAGVAPHA